MIKLKFRYLETELRRDKKIQFLSKSDDNFQHIQLHQKCY